MPKIGTRVSKAGKAIGLNMANPGSISCILHGFPNTVRSNCNPCKLRDVVLPNKVKMYKIR